MPDSSPSQNNQNFNCSTTYEKIGETTEKNQYNLSDFLQENKLPTRKDKFWKYTSLNWLKHTHFTSDNHFDYASLENWVTALLKKNNLETIPRLVCVNGYIVTSLTTLFNNPTINVTLNAQPCADSKKNKNNFLNRLNETCNHTLIEFKVKKNTDAGTVLILSLGQAFDTHAIAFHPRFQWVLEENAKLSILELNSGKGTYFNNPVRHIILNKKSCLEFNNFISPSFDSYLCSNLFVKLAEHAQYKQFLMTKEAKFARQEINVELAGEWSEASFRAIQILNANQHSDITTNFVHHAPHCTSFQHVKNIVSEQSQAVFQGKVLVERQAQKTSAEQQNQTLLLSDQAEINTKPELEIYADDVKCSHGATVGALDQGQLFYLMSRGISSQQAKQILINAFGVETIDHIPNGLAKNFFNKHLNTEILEGL